ncbi:MAG: hypothetical protein AB7N91_19975 [Candidatus Tectimicrobiota bacterium]
MASIPIQNETEYTLTDDMTAQIIRDVQEYFGETVSAIKVQYGIERHAYNARTGEVRYAFSPNDFGLIDTTTSLPDTYYHAADIPTIDDDTEAGIVPAVYEDVAASEEEEEEEEEERRETSLESLEEELDDDEEEEDDFPELDDQFEDTDEEDSFMYDDDDYN